MREVLKTIIRTSHTELPVLIRGETGTGKEMVARYVHACSKLRNGPFVKVNCAAIPVHLLESELLGYEKGAFTGAGEAKPGLVELASGGTLFLDEIGDMNSSLQSKMLHLLQDGRYVRVGGAEERRARVRIVCATNSDLEHAVEEGTFRADLFYRIDVITLRLSALRDRREDIPQLCEHFREKLGKRLGLPTAPLSKLTLHLLQQLSWSGNIRELENWVTREIVLGPNEALSHELARQFAAASTLANRQFDGQLKQRSRESARAAERALILKQLEANHWNRRKTSRDLNISYRSLLYKLREAGVPSIRRRAAERAEESLLPRTGIPK
jgi:two-component system response regulator AtoC